MIKKCTGCGAILQSEISNKPGYIRKEKLETALYCERCFKIKNYGECDIVNDVKDFNNIIKHINSDNYSAVYLVDVLNMCREEIEYIKKFNKKLIVLLTKKDLLPKSVKDKKLIEYFRKEFYDAKDIMCISSYKKYNIDKFLKILKERNIKNIYVVGLTNAGKSSFINSILSSTCEKPFITTSAVPNTTSDFMNIEVGDITVIDTPGFITKNSIHNYLNVKEIVKIMPKKEIKPKTYQIKPNQSVIIDNILRIDHLGKKTNSFTFFINNNLKFERIKITTNDKLRALPKKNIHINGKEDVVVNGLGFIKIMKETDITIYTLDENLISVRNMMI